MMLLGLIAFIVIAVAGSGYLLNEAFKKRMAIEYVNEDRNIIAKIRETQEGDPFWPNIEGEYWEGFVGEVTE